MAAAPLAPSDRAPDFTLDDQFGQPVSLAGLVAGGPVLLVFYPFAFSSTCTGEMQQLQQQLPAFHDDGVQVLGLSCDPMFAQRAWADAEGLGFGLLSDFWPHGAVSRAYGVFDEQAGMPVRGTFLVGPDSRVRWALTTGPGQSRDFTAVQTALADLG